MKGQVKISSLIIALLLVGLFVSTFGLFIANMAENYNQEYNTTEYELYLQSSAINSQIQSINQTLNTASPESTDQANFVTAFLGSGWSVLKTTFQSFGIFNTVADAALDEAQLGSGTSNFKSYLIAIAAVLFLFAIISILVGREA